MSTVEAPPLIAPSTRLTPADLLALPDEQDYELIDGKLVERGTMGYFSNRVTARLIALLYVHCSQMKLGEVIGSDQGYQCFPDDPNKVRKPDVSFLSLDKLRGVDMSGGYCRLAPDMAAEVISPNDLVWELMKKVQDYQAAGVRLVWVVDPVTERIQVYRQQQASIILDHTDELTGDDVIPGFRCPVADLFAPTPGLV